MSITEQPSTAVRRPQTTFDRSLLSPAGRFIDGSFHDESGAAILDPATEDVVARVTQGPPRTSTTPSRRPGPRRPVGAACTQEEIFGPAVTVETFSDEDEAIARANEVSWGGFKGSGYGRDLSLCALEN
jgi:hypothetical protein